MKTRNHTVTAIIAAFVLAATGSTSLAATGNGTSSEAGRAALSVAQAKISPAQAIAAAEAKAGGKAIEADLEHEKGSVVYDVEVLAANGTKHDVKVNADNGQVISSKVDHPD